MIKLRRLHDFRGRDGFADYLAQINHIRSNYKWSDKTYDESNSENVLIVCSFNKSFGYVDAELRDADLSRDNRIYIFIHDLHLAPSQQRSGAGTAVLRKLLNKGVDLEFIVARRNNKVQGLVGKFVHTEKYVTEDTATIRIAAADNLRDPQPNSSLNPTPLCGST